MVPVASQKQGHTPHNQKCNVRSQRRLTSGCVGVLSGLSLDRKSTLLCNIRLSINEARKSFIKGYNLKLNKTPC